MYSLRYVCNSLFITAPGVFNDAAVSIVVRFKQNDLTPKVDMEFEVSL